MREPLLLIVVGLAIGVLLHGGLGLLLVCIGLIWWAYNWSQGRRAS